MKPNRTQFLAIAALMVALLGLPLPPAAAQSSPRVQISTVRTESFPEILLYASASDEAGNRITGLSENDFTILEDGIELDPISVREERLGTRQIYFLNTSLAIALRDASGLSRLDYARQALFNWWQIPDAARIGLDDLNLYTSDTALAVHETSAAVLAAQISAYSSDYELDTFPYQRMQQILLTARDPLPREGMTTSLIFLTPMVRGPELEDLENAITAAQELNVAVYTILLAAPEDLENPIAAEMQRLSVETGGQMVLLDPEAGLSDLAQTIISQQSQYILRYQSRVNSSGEHILTLAARAGGALEGSNEVTFSVDLQPPIVTFLNFPAEITRKTDDPTVALEEISPTDVDIAVSVNFPDGYPRDLSAASLLVNGEVVEVNTGPPFTRFEWDISTYTTNTELALTVMVEDSLGIMAETSALPVNILLELPPSGLAALRPALNNLFLTVASILLGISLLAGIVVIIRKAADRSARLPEQQQRLSSAQLPAVSPRPVRHSSDDVPEAALTSTGPLDFSMDLIGVDHTIGSDAALATILLQDPSVEALHARLIRHANGRYLLKDTGSAAGTWVNFQEIPESGMILVHGDLVHFGRSGFRYTRRSPSESNSPAVTDIALPVQTREPD